MGRFTFGKNEKLCSRTAIDALFKHGDPLKVYPLRVLAMPVETLDTTAKVLISVPKKRLPKSVSRNRTKRLIREVYRLNKPELLQTWHQQGKYFALAFVYIGTEIPNFNELNTAMKRVLEQLKSI